jgi:hypothetical protein
MSAFVADKSAHNLGGSPIARSAISASSAATDNQQNFN